MLALARFLIFGAVVLTVVYGTLWFYLRARRRALLEEAWAADATLPGDREAYVRAALAEHDRRRRRLLLPLVYLLPLCLVALTVYRTNLE